MDNMDQELIGSAINDKLLIGCVSTQGGHQVD